MNAIEENMGNLLFDLYEDSILLMDEAQLACNYDWLSTQIGVLKHHEWTVLLLPTSGSIEMELLGEVHRCSIGQVAVYMLDSGCTIKRISDDFAARTIAMNIEFVNGLNISDALDSSLALKRSPIIDITPQIHQAILLVFDQLRGIIAASDNPYRFRAVQTLVETYHYSIGYYLHRGADTRRGAIVESLADQFLHMAERDFKQHRDLDHYAQALYVGKKHLSASVAKVTGKPATHWIERNVVLFAKQQLAHSPLTVAEIAADLHFANQSHFGTYFKRATGLSPQAYRRSTKHSD